MLFQNSSMEAPPSYTDAVQLPPFGEDNPSFFFGEVFPSNQGNLETQHETPRNNPTLPTSLQTNNDNQNELSVSEDSLHIVESCSNPLMLVFSQSSVNSISIQNTEETNINPSTTHSELHI